MAKETKKTNQSTPETIVIQPRKSDMEVTPSFFDRIKLFFQGLKEKWSEFWNDVLHPNNEPTPEPKPYKPSDQILSEYNKFPGFDEMTMDNGLVRIPAGTEKITGWSLDEKQHYLDILHTKFPQMPNPIETHDGAFITQISSNVYSMLKSDRDNTSIYAIANNLIIASHKDGECNITITDGQTEHSVTIDSIENISSKLAILFTEHMNPENKESFMLDMKRDVGYLQRVNPQGECESYKIEHHHHHINDYANKVFIDHKHPMPAILELQGPGIVSRETLDKLFPVDVPMERGDFDAVITALHEPLFKNPGYNSTFVTQDKAFWISYDGDKAMINVAPVHCKYPNVPTVTRPVPEEAYSFAKEGKYALRKALQSAIKAVDKQIEHLDELAEKSKPFERDPSEHDVETPPEHADNNAPEATELPDIDDSER